MDAKKRSSFKWLAIVMFTAVGFVVMAYQLLPAAAAEVIVAQSTNQTTAPEGETSSSESQPTESKAAEEKETNATKNRKLKDFRPSEKIEAEQAVDFPYDI